MYCNFDIETDIDDCIFGKVSADISGCIQNAHDEIYGIDSIECESDDGIITIDTIKAYNEDGDDISCSLDDDFEKRNLKFIQDSATEWATFNGMWMPDEY